MIYERYFLCARCTYIGFIVVVVIGVLQKQQKGLDSFI